MGEYRPPYNFFRKSIIQKLMVYGVDEEEGEQSKMRDYLFDKYKRSIYFLRKRLDQERQLLIQYHNNISW
jgi:hypothetical protein